MTSPHEFLHPKHWKPAHGYSNGVAAFTMAKAGVMGEAAIGGQKFSFVPSP